MGPRAGLDGWKISSSLGFDPGPSSPQSVEYCSILLINPVCVTEAGISAELIAILAESSWFSSVSPSKSCVSHSHIPSLS